MLYFNISKVAYWTKWTFHISVVGAGIIEMGKINCLRLDKRTRHTCNRELSVLERCPAGDVPLYINSIFRTWSNEMVCHQINDLSVCSNIWLPVFYHILNSLLVRSDEWLSWQQSGRHPILATEVRVSTVQLVLQGTLYPGLDNYLDACLRLMFCDINYLGCMVRVAEIWIKTLVLPVFSLRFKVDG